MKHKDKTTKEYMDKVAQLGCLICNRPTNLHHIRTQGVKDDFLIIPLCKEHHQGAFSIHNCKYSFEKTYGSELELLAKTIKNVFKNINNDLTTKKEYI